MSARRRYAAVALIGAALLGVALATHREESRDPGLAAELPALAPQPQAAPSAELATARELPGLPLRRVLASQSEVRAAVAAANAATRDDAAALRATALGAVDPTVAGRALRALGRLGLVAGDAELGALYDDPRPRVRQELVYALAQSGDPRAQALLERARASDDATLRQLATAR
jgi:hypothetical protein